MMWLSGRSHRNWERGVTHVQDADLEILGVPRDGIMEVVDDRRTTLRSMENGSRDDNETNTSRPREDAALKFGWERLESVHEVNAVYLWYKNMQENALAFGIPLMPFRGITLRHDAYGLMLPGMGHELWKTGGRLLLRVLRYCIPDDASEEADNIREMMACHVNGFESLWYILKVVAGLMDAHNLPSKPVYAGSLSKHAAAWEVYRMLMNHRGTQYRAEDAGIQFLRDIVCQRFSPAAKVELGMLMSKIPDGVKSGKDWVMPARYRLRVMASRILEASPGRAVTERDMARPSMLSRVKQDVDERPDEDSEGWDANEGEHLQGYGLKINSVGYDGYAGRGDARGPNQMPPDPRATRQRRQQRRPPRHQARCRACGKYGHEEARCEFLAMFLWCRRYMKGKSEEEVASVFDHWTERNQKDPTYARIREGTRERGISIRRIEMEMDWGYFAPLTRDECMQVSSPDAQDDKAWDAELGQE